MLVARRPPGCWRVSPFSLTFLFFVSFCQGTLLATFGFLWCFFSWLGFGIDLHCSGHRGLRPLIPVLRQVRAGCTGFDGEDRCFTRATLRWCAERGIGWWSCGVPGRKRRAAVHNRSGPFVSGWSILCFPLFRCFLSLACLWRGR